MIEFQRLKFGLWVVTFNLQTSMQLNLSTKLWIFNYGLDNWGHILWIDLSDIGQEEIWG